jgi:hypothetical protein
MEARRLEGNFTGLLRGSRPGSGHRSFSSSHILSNGKFTDLPNKPVYMRDTSLG